jgi:hypothetical protein
MTDEPVAAADISEYYTATTTTTATKAPMVVTTQKTQKPSKKRKLTGAPDNAEMKQKARMLCGSIEQWKIVSRYPSAKLLEWIETREFDRDTAFRDSAFSFVHRGLALILDTVGAGGGHIESEVLADESLRCALAEELYQYVGLLRNRYKILALSMADFSNGKRQQWKANPVQSEPVIEEIPNVDGTTNQEGATTNNGDAGGSADMADESVQD